MSNYHFFIFDKLILSQTGGVFMLDYRMETFLTLCQTLNYRATAQMLHITQPAVTQQIHCLEGAACSPTTNVICP